MRRVVVGFRQHQHRHLRVRSSERSWLHRRRPSIAREVEADDDDEVEVASAARNSAFCGSCFDHRP